MEKYSCGQMAFQNLCIESGVRIEKVVEVLEEEGEKEESSFADFEKWCVILGLKGIGMEVDNPSYFEPFIAQLSSSGYQHFVMVKKYRGIVTYYDVDKKVHRLPKFLFKLLFTGRIFVLDM